MSGTVDQATALNNEAEATFKQCPVCGAKCFTDMDVCYNCLHSFALSEQEHREEQVPLASVKPIEVNYPQAASAPVKAPSFAVLGASCEGSETQPIEAFAAPEKPFGSGLHSWSPAPRADQPSAVEPAVNVEEAPLSQPTKIAVSNGSGKEVLRFQPSQYVEIVINVQPAKVSAQ